MRQKTLISLKSAKLWLYSINPKNYYEQKSVATAITFLNKSKNSIIQNVGEFKEVQYTPRFLEIEPLWN